jgi:hypothetical protein
VWLRKRFVPEDTALDPVITELAPYVWNGSGNPCYADTTKPPTHADNLIEGPPQNENEPATDGTTFIEIVKWSCVPTYEPDHTDPGNLEPNGFPPLPEE